jgi:hypothetical protein
MRARPQVAQMASPTLRCTAFAGHRRIASGELRHVALKAKQARDLGRPVLVFEDASCSGTWSSRCRCRPPPPRHAVRAGRGWAWSRAR